MPSAPPPPPPPSSGPPPDPFAKKGAAQAPTEPTKRKPKPQDEGQVTTTQPVSGAGGTPNLGWKIATGVLALCTGLALIWGWNTQRNADEVQQAQQTEIASLQNEVKQVQEEGRLLSAAQQVQLEDAQTRYKKVENRLKVARSNAKTAESELKGLSQKLQKEEAEARATDASLREKLQAANARAKLATACARVMADGLHQIYQARNPNELLDDVVATLETASVHCKGVVSIQE